MHQRKHVFHQVDTQLCAASVISVQTSGVRGDVQQIAQNLYSQEETVVT